MIFIELCLPLVKTKQDKRYALKERLNKEDRNAFILATFKETEEHEKRGFYMVWEWKCMPSGSETIMSIWSLKRKHFPDGRLMKHKVRLHAHGGMQLWGVN